MSGKVSVVVTCYNYGGYLGECLNSVLSQSYSDLEIILVNDGSTDQSAEVARAFLNEPRVRYIEQENAGQARAKNVGIAHSTGEFVAFLDADDAWEREKLKKQIPLFGDPRIGVVYSLARYVDAEGREVELDRSHLSFHPHAGNVTRELFMDNFVPFSSSVVRKEILDRAAGFDERLKMGIDWDLWLRLSLSWTFGYVDDALLVYRVGHPGQMSKNTVVRHRCVDRIMASFLERYPGVLPQGDIRKAFAYTHANRGYHYSDIEPGVSIANYLRAIRLSPLYFAAYRGIIRTLFRTVAGTPKGK
jgi:glycosyltransferase involved in cell wall biosynthesis